MGSTAAAAPKSSGTLPAPRARRGGGGSPPRARARPGSIAVARRRRGRSRLGGGARSRDTALSTPSTPNARDLPRAAAAKRPYGRNLPAGSQGTAATKSVAASP